MTHCKFPQYSESSISCESPTSQVLTRIYEELSKKTASDVDSPNFEIVPNVDHDESFEPTPIKLLLHFKHLSQQAQRLMNLLTLF